MKEWPVGHSDMASRVRAFDWATTPLGPCEQWPQSLRTAVDLMLGSGHAMQLAWGPQKIILYNDAYAPMLAKRHPRALGLPFHEAWPDIWQEIEPLVDRVFAGETVRFEAMPLVMTRHGFEEETWWNFSYSPVRDESGNVAALLNVTVDATPKIRADRAEQALRESEMQFRQVLDGMGEGFSLLDRDLRVITQNEAALRLDGRPLESVRGGPHAEIYPGAGPELLRLYERALSEGVPVSLEHRYGQVDGHARWLEMRAYPIPQGLAVFSRDISERRAGQEALRRSEERFRSMADTAPAMLWMTNPDNELEFISRGWFECTGQDQACAYRDGLGWLDMVHELDREAAVVSFVAAAERQEPFELQYRLRRSDGSYRWAIDAGRPRHGEAGEWLGYIGSVVDVHDHACALEALREADRHKNEFLAMLAHELRNPLGAVGNALRLLSMTDEAAQTARLHEMLKRQFGQLARLVDDLLESSRISRGQLELKLEPLDLGEVLQRAIETSKATIDQARHRFDFVAPCAPLSLHGDGVRLAQVFSNLLNNAAKYTDPGGHIVLSARHADGSAVISVRDDGIGIAGDQLPRVFDMFAQIDPASHRNHGGLGIGLALARRIIEMHGGRIEAKSDGLGTGSTFTIRLPLGGPHKEVTGSARTMPELDAKRVLVVDDNRDAADSLGMLLRYLGAQVSVEYCGADALAAVMTWRPSIVLLDLGMPGMDGFEVARRLRANPQLEGLKLIALTGWGQEQDRLRTRSEGFDEHLIKPVELDVLLELMTSLD